MTQPMQTTEGVVKRTFLAFTVLMGVGIAFTGALAATLVMFAG